MSKVRIKTLLDVTANTTGTAVAGIKGKKTFHVVITGTATVVVEASMDGSNYEQLLTTTADGIWENDAPWSRIRAVSSSMSSGTAKVYMGFEHRND